jgi:hypothetical protein
MMELLLGLVGTTVSTGLPLRPKDDLRKFQNMLDKMKDSL